MTHDQADTLAGLISQTWHRAAPPDIWADELRELDHARAEQAYRQLRRNSDHAPTIAQYLAAYHGLLGTARTDTGCTDCHDTGWVTCTDHPHHHGHWHGREQERPIMHTKDGPDPRECICNVVRPCHCATGRARNARRREAAA